MVSLRESDEAAGATVCMRRTPKRLQSLRLVSSQQLHFPMCLLGSDQDRPDDPVQKRVAEILPHLMNRCRKAPRPSFLS